jgi:hypothetical protein
MRKNELKRLGAKLGEYFVEKITSLGNMAGRRRAERLKPWYWRQVRDGSANFKRDY